jgi:putative methyltransferase
MNKMINGIVVLPRYIRVNRLVTTVDQVIQHFVSEGYSLIPSTQKLQGKTIQQDVHLPDLLLLPNGVDLHDHVLLKQGKIIMQDKASCFPAFILNPPKGATVIDGCAAPGNKTSHLSSIMENTGKIFAFDADKRRLETLKRLSQRAHCSSKSLLTHIDRYSTHSSRFFNRRSKRLYNRRIYSLGSILFRIWHCRATGSFNGT